MTYWQELWAGSIAVFLILSFLTPNAFAADAWCNLSTCDDNWDLRKKITIDNAQVSGTPHTDFAVLISLSSDTDLNSSNVQSAGEDIRFTNEDGSAVLSYEIESFSNDGTDGTLVAWVKIPTLSATADTVLYMYYGNSGVSSTANAANVWDTNYKGVWHLPEDPSGTAPQMLDSTSNDNDGTSVGSMTTSDQVAGQIDGSLDLDGTDDEISISDNSSLDITNKITIESWINTSNLPSFPMPLCKGNVNTSYLMFISTNPFINPTKAVFRIVSSGDTAPFTSAASTTSVDDGLWHHVVGTFDGTDMKIYVDGTLEGTSNQPGKVIDTNNDPLFIGNCNAGTLNFDGMLDEIRLSNIDRSSDFIETEYNNQNSPSTFYSASSEQVFLSTPPSLSANQGNTQMSLEWTAPTSGTSSITDYIVEYKQSSSGIWLTFDDGIGTSTSATVTGLTNGVSYDFRVSATSSGVLGSASSTATIDPAATSTKATQSFDTSANLSFDDATVTATGSGSITIEKLNSNPEASSPSGTIIGSFFDISSADVLTDRTVIMSYSDADITGLVESSLIINRFSGEVWTELTTTVDADANTATATTPGFSGFVLDGTSTGGGGGDVKPSYSVNFAENEYPITIDNTKFKFEELGFDNPTTIIETGKPILVNLLIYDNEGPSYIQQVELYTNLNGLFRDVSNSDTSIIYQKGNPLEILDPNGFFSEVIFSSSEVNKKLQLTYEITFAKEMEKSDIIVQARDKGNNVAILTVSDAWQVILDPTIIETSETIITEPTDVSVPVEIKVKTLSVEKPAYSMQEEILFSGTIDVYEFRKIVTIIIHNPSNNFVTLISTFPDKEGYFEARLDIDSKFKTDGTYTATAFTDDLNRGMQTTFNFSRDAPPLSPVITLPAQSTQAEPTTTAELIPDEPTTISELIPYESTTTAELTTPEPKPRPSFVDPEKDPHYYIGRYNNEAIYKEWFNENYPDYTIYEALDLPNPKAPQWVKNNAKWWAEEEIDNETFVSGIQFLITEKIIDIPDLPEQASEKPRPSFVDPEKDPQSYVDRYNNEESYKEWFDENYSDYTIEEAVGMPESIPEWIKNNAKWWADDLLSEEEFLNGIKYLVEKKIIRT